MLTSEHYTLTMYNLFGPIIYHKPHYIFKSKYFEFHNQNIGPLSINDTRMAGTLMKIQIGLRMKKYFLSQAHLHN